MKEVTVAHRNAKTWSDKFALTMVTVLRWGLDRATGYVHKDAKELAAMVRWTPAAWRVAIQQHGTLAVRRYLG